ncbi:hypothetical protein QQ056_08380 [Oscillatoria laete-virens NRMC-F 0139]|nr:hypothetical protein [Oscillatoria laete-virens NRMC-F 0139]
MSTLVIKSFPPELHARIKESAAANRRSVTQETIVLLEKAIETTMMTGENRPPYFATRKPRPEFQKLEEQGHFRPGPGDRDITEFISEDRE